MPSRPRRWPARLALLLVGSLMPLALMEIVLRTLGSGAIRFPPPRFLESADKRLALDLYPTNPHGEFDLDIRDASTRARFAALGDARLAAAAARTPYGVRFDFNEDLCRDRARAPRVNGVSRLLVLGDSFTEGEGVRERDVFARVLERRLRARGLSVEVYNCGRRGRDFPLMFDAFRSLLAYQPDVVLYAMVLNDPVQSPAFRSRQAFLNDWIMDRRRTSTEPSPPPWWQSRLVSFARDRIERWRVARATTQWYRDMYAGPNAAGWRETQSDMRAMDAAMRARGGRLVVGVLPLLVGLDRRYPFEQVHREIARACTANRLDCVDTLPAFRGLHPEDLWVHPVDMHPDARGHAIIAEAVMSTVERALRAQRALTNE